VIHPVRNPHPPIVPTMPDEHSNTITRRKFTITESLDEVLVEMADQNYHGNVSLCLRTAIEDHRGTLNGTDTAILIRQIANRIDNLQSNQQDIADELDQLQETLEHETNRMFGQVSKSRGKTEDMQRIISLLRTTENGLRFEDIGNQLGLPDRRIHTALGVLLDHGDVVTVNQTPTRFYLAGMSEGTIDE